MCVCVSCWTLNQVCDNDVFHRPMCACFMLNFKPSRIMMSVITLCVRVSFWTLNQVCDNDVLDPPLCRQTAVGWNGKNHFGSCRSTKMIKFVSFERRKNGPECHCCFSFQVLLFPFSNVKELLSSLLLCLLLLSSLLYRPVSRLWNLKVQSTEFEWKSIVMQMLCAFSIQKLPRLLVVNLEGMMFIYNLDPNESGECQLVRQHRLVS